MSFTLCSFKGFSQDLKFNISFNTIFWLWSISFHFLIINVTIVFDNHDLLSVKIVFVYQWPMHFKITTGSFLNWSMLIPM